MKCIIPECSNLAKQSLTGRPGKYCSNACRQRGYRSRQYGVTKLACGRVTKLPDIQFYCGLNEKYWNYHVIEPGTHVCIAPVTSTMVEEKTGEKRRKLVKTQVLIDDAKIKHVLVDSGAFSDSIELKDGQIARNNRLSFDHALQRQIAHAYEFRYAHLVEAIVSYDLLIDEVWQNDTRDEQRWSTEAASYAVNETIEAARFLSSQRRRIDHVFGHHVNLVLSAQGVNACQYLRCAEEIVPLMQSGDVFGLGGWCITGLRRHVMLPAAGEILPGVFEILGEAGIRRVHVFGVMIPSLLGFLLWLCDQHGGIQLSTDSAGPCVEPVRNGNWGYGSWTDPKYKKPSSLPSCRVVDHRGIRAPTCIPDTRCAGLERCRHVRLTREWLTCFRERESRLVRSLPVPDYRQLVLMGQEGESGGI